MMRKQIILKCSEEKLKSFFRFEIYCSDLCASEPADRIVLKTKVFIDFEDILSALKNMRSRREKTAVIQMEWLQPLFAMGNQIGLNVLLGLQDIRDFDSEQAGYSLPLDREGALLSLFSMLEECQDGELTVQIMDELIGMLENVLYNEKHAKEQWKLTSYQKKRYVEYLYDRDLVDISDDPSKALFKKCLEEGCADGDHEAWRIKAYCLYGGNSIYQCDWVESGRLLRLLYDEEENPYDAEALGILLYKGLGSDDADYEEAYRYCTIGAFNGLYRSMCLCADMLVRGEGTPMSMEAAERLVESAYGHTKALFADGKVTVPFAEAALRMGDCTRYGIGMEADGMTAFSYYLEAMNAISLRMQVHQECFDSELYDTIMNRVKECQEAFGRQIQHTHYTCAEPYIIQRMLSAGQSLMVTLIEEEGKNYLLFSRIPSEESGYILVTCEEMEYSLLQKQALVEIEGLSGTSLHEGKAVCFDNIAYDEENKETIFMKGRKKAGKLSCENFKFADGRRQGWRKEPLLHFAAVVFPGSTKEYDYINTLSDLKKGDHVLVETKNGPDEAIFLREYQARMSDMPLNRYRKILQKISFHLYA